MVLVLVIVIVIVIVYGLGFRVRRRGGPDSLLALLLGAAAEPEGLT